jgi:hypothetical protein
MWRKVSGRASQAGVEVILRGTLGNSAKTVTNADATFEFSRLIPDRYTIWAGSTAVTLILNDRDIRGVTLPSYSVTKVSGRVDVEGGRGLPMLMSLSLTSSAPPFTSPSLPLFLGIKTDGSFTAEIPEGSYRVALADREMPPGYRLKSIEYGGTNILDGVLVVGPEARDLRIVLAAPPSPAGVRVSGRVDVSAIGGGAAIPRVILARHFPSWTFVAAPAPDGVFEFRDVSPGTYRIWLEGAARAPAVVYVGPQDVAGVTLAAPERATKPQ